MSKETTPGIKRKIFRKKYLYRFDLCAWDDPETDNVVESKSLWTVGQDKLFGDMC